MGLLQEAIAVTGLEEPQDTRAQKNTRTEANDSDFAAKATNRVALERLA